MINDYLKEKINNLMTMIDAYDSAIIALVGGGVQSYMLDTGQTRQSVTKMDIASLQRNRSSLYNELVTLNARANGGNVGVVRPAW